MKTLKYFFLSAALVFSFACSSTPPQEHDKPEDLSIYTKAYFAAGCFWCVEAIYQSVEGVAEVVSGYSGGSKKDADYGKVSSARTKHAESVVVYYDAKIVTYETLLKVFFGSHDPTTPNQQGPDKGPQYRSVIFYQNESEETLARDYISELTKKKEFGSAKMVTEVVPFEAFYEAEDYHQDYEERNPYHPYVMNVSIPRLNKFKKKFPELLKK